MRDIKFRGLDLNSGKWVYGYYAQKRGISRIFDDDGNFWYVDRETVGQYVGEVDGDGKEIYEGDILKDPDEDFVWAVEWQGGYFGIVSQDGSPVVECIGDVAIPPMEVIGNIHENPELLEEEDDENN